MQLFVTAIQHPIQFGIAAVIAGAFVLIFLRAAMSPERRAGSIGWVRAITGPSTRYLFAFLAIAWAAGFGFLIPQFPNVADSATLGNCGMRKPNPAAQATARKANR